MNQDMLPIKMPPFLVVKKKYHLKKSAGLVKVIFIEY